MADDVKEVSIIQQEGETLFVKDAAVRQRLAQVEVIIDENNIALQTAKSNKHNFVVPKKTDTEKTAITLLDDTITINGTVYNIYRLLSAHSWENFSVSGLAAFGGLEYSRVVVDSENYTGGGNTFALETTYSDIFGASFDSVNGRVTFMPANGIIDVERFPNPKRIDIVFYAVAR